MATIKIRRGSSDPTAAQVTSAGELAANISTPKVWLKTADDGTTTPIWVGAQIENSSTNGTTWTSDVKLATKKAIGDYFFPISGGTFTGVVSFGQGATAPGEIRLLEDTDDGANYSAFRGSARAANITYLMPTTDPTAGQVLSAAAPTANVSQLSWANASSATTVTTNSDNTNTTRYLVMSTSAQSGATLYVDDTTGPLSYNPSTANMSIAGDLALNGGDLTTTSATATLFNSGATTLNIGGAATSMTIGTTVDENATLNLLTAAVTTGKTKTINIGTGNDTGASNINIGSDAGGIITLGSTEVTVASALTINDNGIIGNSVVGNSVDHTVNIVTDATASTKTKTINIGTNSAAGSTTNITIGSTAGTSTVYIKGNLQIDGTTTTVNTSTLTVDDLNIVIGDGVTTAAGGDGAGLSIGTSGVTLTYNHGNTAWQSTENLNIANGKTYKINGTTVLSGSALGSGVTGSSLTSVGTITSGTWNGTDIGLADGGTNASLTAVNGGIVYSTASALAISSAGSSNQVLLSGGAGAPTWTNQSALSVGSATSATTATNIIATEQTTGTMYLVGVSGASSSTGILVDATATTPLSYDVATGTLTTVKVEAIVDGGTY